MTLQDSKAATVADCGAHFYLTEADAGKNRAEACAQQMQELNPGVRVSTLSGGFPTDLSGYHVVVAVDLSLEEALQADAVCRSASPPIAFIRADIRGLAASVFVDLGPSFTCLDPTGESVKSAIVEHVVVVEEKEGATKLRVQCVDDEAPGLSPHVTQAVTPHHRGCHATHMHMHMRPGRDRMHSIGYNPMFCRGSTLTTATL